MDILQYFLQDLFTICYFLIKINAIGKVVCQRFGQLLSTDLKWLDLKYQSLGFQISQVTIFQSCVSSHYEEQSVKENVPSNFTPKCSFFSYTRGSFVFWYFHWHCCIKSNLQPDELSSASIFYLLWSLKIEMSALFLVITFSEHSLKYNLMDQKIRTFFPEYPYWDQNHDLHS